MSTDAMRALADNTLSLVASFRAELATGTMGTLVERTSLTAYEGQCASLIGGGGTTAELAALGRLATAFGWIDDLIDFYPPTPAPAHGARLDGSDPAQSGVNALFL